MDIQKIQQDFPILTQPGAEHIVYADNNASTQKPRAVLAAITDVYETTYANIHRGVYPWSEESSARFEGTRERLQRFLNTRQATEIVFTRNTTEAVNLLAATWGEQHIGAGDEIIVTEMEHHANLLPWQQLAKRKGAHLVFWPVTDDGRLDMTVLPGLCTKKTKLLTLVHMSNTLGTVNDVAAAAAVAHEHGVPCFVDGAQAAGHFPVDVQALNVDAYMISAHKMCGPSGAGALYMKMELLKDLPPYQFGGAMIENVERTDATWNDVPWRFEAGTPAIESVIAFGAALEYLDVLGRDAIWQHEQDLAAYGLQKFGEIPNVRILGPKDAANRGATFSLDVPGVHPHDLGSLLAEQGVYVRAGHHCTQLLHQRFGIAASTRASFYLYNTQEDIERSAAAVQTVVKVLQ